MAGKDATVCVVGDTPRDIDGRGHFSVIAVATGNYSSMNSGNFSGRPAPLRWPTCLRSHGTRRDETRLKGGCECGEFPASICILIGFARSRFKPFACSGCSRAAERATSANDKQRRQAATCERPAARGQALSGRQQAFMDEHFEDALQQYELAAKLDSGNANYRLAADVARSHAVTALIQTAAKDRNRGDSRRAGRAGPCLATRPQTLTPTASL